MKSRLTAALALAALTAAGVLAALAIAPSALAWSPTNLPPGWTVHHIAVGGVSSCAERYQIFKYTNGVFQDVSAELCVDSPTYQQDFDAWVDARYTAPVTTAAATTTAATTTDTATVPVGDPPATPTTSTPSEPAPAPVPPPSTTNAVTVTVTTVVDSTIADQLAAIEAKLKEIETRVERLELANSAAGLAYDQAIAAGADLDAAYQIAVGTFLNAEHRLGEFA